MKRVFISQTPKFVNKEIKVCGWVNTIRSHGKINFIDLRDKSGILQVVMKKEWVKKIKEEDVLLIIGKIQPRPANNINPNLSTGKIEMLATNITLISEAKPIPFDIKNLNLSLPKLLDFRPLVIRNEKIQAIFKIQETLIDSFRTTLKKFDFFEFQAPTIVASATEGGANLFQIDYYGKKAFLAQSPQLYKQILVSAFERVFTVTKAFRAEPSITTRHLTEYVSLDCEMGFIESWEELLEICEKVIKNMLKEIDKKHKKELTLFKATLPNVKNKFPRLKLRDAQNLVFKLTGKNKTENSDLDPGDEKIICNYAKKQWNSDFVFITHFPTEKRPFYTHPDPNNRNFTLSFDLLFRGLEVVTGGQRIHDYEMCIANMKKFGLNPKNFEFYLQAFKYGMPPEGGFAIGSERMVKQILGLDNVREAAIFPRDIERVDQRLAKINQKKQKK